MTPRIQSVVKGGALFCASLLAPLAHAQEANPAAGSVQEELRALRQLIEQQSKQIDMLSAQVTRLGGELERRNMATPTAPLGSGAGEASGDAGGAPVAKPAPAPTPAGQTPPAANHSTPQTPQNGQAPQNVHVVVKGDSLEKIARQHNTSAAELQKLNKINDPKKLQIGQQLTLPGAPAEKKPE